MKSFVLTRINYIVQFDFSKITYCSNVQPFRHSLLIVSKNPLGFGRKLFAKYRRGGLLHMVGTILEIKKFGELKKSPKLAQLPTQEFFKVLIEIDLLLTVDKLLGVFGHPVTT